MVEKEQNDEIKRRLEEMKLEQEKLAEPVSEEEQKEIVRKLYSAYNTFLEEYNFIEGQLVEWKHGLKNRILPRPKEPAIVIKILETPIFDVEKNAGSTYFREPLDMIIGVIEKNKGELLFFHVDRRRFKPFENDPTSR